MCDSYFDFRFGQYKMILVLRADERKMMVMSAGGFLGRLGFASRPSILPCGNMPSLQRLDRFPFCTARRYNLKPLSTIKREACHY